MMEKVISGLNFETNTLTLEEQITLYHALDQWFKTPHGLRVSHAFASGLKEMADLLGGKRLLQLGCCADNVWLSSLHFRNKWFVTPCESSNKSTLVASILSLPLERNSVDCVIAPFTLEVFGHDKNPIDEIDRVLKPMGYVIFLGINPWSFWGAALRFGASTFGEFSGKLSSALTLKHAMLSRGYSQCMLSSFYYIPPVANKTLIHHLKFFNEIGKMIWPFPAGFYCLVVQKYQPASPNLIFNRFDDLLYVARN
jgi:SAM-dependent methyltransferase